MVRKPILTKSSKTVNKKLVKRRLSPNQRAFAFLFGIPLIVFAFIALLSYIPQYIAEQADRDKFAKIETLVDSIKVDLEKTYPDKQWEIVKYCQASRGEFGNVVAISCSYGVKGVDVTLYELDQIVARYLSKAGDSSRYRIGTQAYKTDVSTVGCVAIASGAMLKDADGANFACDDHTGLFIYPEIPR